MTDTIPRAFDFREIAALDGAAKVLRDWVGKSSSFFSDFWSEVSDYAAPLTLGNVTTNSYRTTVESLSREVNYSMVHFVDHARSMWYASNRDFRAIASAMLGLDQDANDSDGDADGDAVVGGDDSPLSPIERSLVQLFLEQLASSLVDGWMGGDAINLQVTQVDLDPYKARFLRDRDLLTCTSVQIGLKTGAVSINWLLPKQRTSELLESVVDRRRDGEAPSLPKNPSAELIGHLPIELVSVLGNATLPMSQLSSLKVGQIIELDQRIDQPVVALVDQSPFYAGWPGRRGKHQAIGITQCLGHQ